MGRRKKAYNFDAKPLPPTTQSQSFNTWTKPLRGALKRAALSLKIWWASALLCAFKRVAKSTLDITNGCQKLPGTPKCSKKSLIELAPSDFGKRLRENYIRRLRIRIDKPIEGSKITATNDEGTGAIDTNERCGGNSRINKKGCHKNFRLQYLQKLSYHKVWLPQHLRPPRKQTVIIFDFDDTLICTTFLNSRKEYTNPSKLKALPEFPELRRIGAAARRLLELAQQLGTTYIITNAEEGWVENAAHKFLPEILPVLQHIRIISARSKFARKFPDNVGEWKANAFVELQRNLDPWPITNFISVGDSQYEADAAKLVSRAFANVCVKTVKFCNAPSPSELLQELSLTEQSFSKVVAHGGSFKKFVICEE